MNLDEMHPAILGSETTDMQAGTMERISDALSKGTQAAAISGGLSIWNTVSGLWGAENIDTEQAIRKYDEQIGDYYADHKSAADIVGFVGTSILPGGLGIKALNMAKAGNATGAVGRYLGLASTRKAEYLQKALAETAESGGTIKGLLSANRRNYLKWEVADQALTGAAAEIAIAATMNDSPIFDKDTLGDFGTNMLLGTVLSGGIGGALASLGARGILKAAQAEIQVAKREADVVFQPERMGLLKGTELLNFAESIAKLPDNFGDIKFKYTLDGKPLEMELPVSEALKAARQRSQTTAIEKLAIEFNNLAEGNANVGQAYFDFIRRASDDVKALGKDQSEVINIISGYLANVKKISHVDLDEMAMDARKFYVTTKPYEGMLSEQGAKALLSPKRTQYTGAQPYRLADGATAENLIIKQLDEVSAPNLTQAFRRNPDLDAIQLPDGTLRINPKSQNILKMQEDPFRVKMFVRLQDGVHSTEAVPVFGDIVAKSGIRAGDDYISTGTRTFKQVAHEAFDITRSPLEASARYAWLSDKGIEDVLRVTGNRVHLDDLPVLQRLVELEPKVSLDTLKKLKFVDANGEVPFEEIIGLKNLLEVQRYELLEKSLNTWDHAKGSVPNLDALAAHLNTTSDWVEDAIARNFRLPSLGDTPKGQALETVAALKPKTVQVEYDFSSVGKKMLPEEAYNMNMGPSHLVTKELTRQYQLEIRKQITSKAADMVLGDDAVLIHDLNQLGKTTSEAGAGATTLGASNAGYAKTALLYVQDTGKAVQLISQKQRDAVVEALSADVNAIRMSPRASAELGAVTTALRKNPNSFILDPSGPQRLISTDAVKLSQRANIAIDEAINQLAYQGGAHPHVYNIDDGAVAAFLRNSAAIDNPRQEKFTTLYNASGLTRNISEFPIIKAPPINTVKYPYHAFVKTKEQIGVPSQTTMITAKSEEQLRELAGKVDRDKFDVFFKHDTDAYFKAKGEYDYDLTLHDAKINSELARSGALSDFFPETRAENILTDWLEWHAKQEEKLVRTAVEVKNRQFFSEMRHLSENYRIESESVARGIGSKFKSKIADPFGDYIKTALNISKQQEVPLLDALNDFVDKLGVKAGDALERARRDSQTGLISYQEANEVAKKYGLGMPYKDPDNYFTANERYPRNLIREGFQKANMFLATATLRLDFANSLLNIISTPIMLGTEMQSIKGLIKKGSPEAGVLAELMSVGVPGQAGARVPSTVKLTANAINNFFGKDKDALISRYREIGSVKEVSQLYHEVLDDLSFRNTVAPTEWLNKVNAAVEKGAKITGNTFAEDFTRFVSADVMRQMTDPLVTAGKMGIKDQNAYISTFVNRVQGNYVTSQRPIVFQGTTGAAISLFQTYAFNVLQQLHRHIEAGDKKTLLTFAGLQSTVFGFNGLPFFDAVNTHLIGSMVANNPEHRDAYNVLPAFNKELGDWMLYGTASAFPLFTGSSPALYTRGDINPRHLTILPVNPLDVPAVQAAGRLYTAVTGFGKNVMNGVDMSDAMLLGLEHQGLNRPLAGFAQLLGGRSTTSKGSLISAANELETTSYLGALAERTSTLGGVSRLLGARPMDEAVALNQMYRNKTYEALDKQRIERLGSVVKSKLYGGEVPTSEEMEDFMLRYTRSGGRIETFSQFMQRAARDANVSVVNQAMDKIKTPYGRNLMTLMGGERLEDYTMAPQAEQTEQPE